MTRQFLTSALSLLLLASCSDSTSSAPPESADGGAPPADASDPPDQLTGPWANVYLQNPFVDKEKTSRVLLEGITDPKGHLTSEHVKVLNCLPEEGGETFSVGIMSIRL